MNGRRRYQYLLSLALLSAFGAACSAEAPAPSEGPPPEGKDYSIQLGDLSRAVARGDEYGAIRLLNRGADINENVGTDENRVTPLLIAVADGNEKITHMLIRSGASLDVQYQGYRPSDFTAYGNQDSTLRLIQTIQSERKK